MNNHGQSIPCAGPLDYHLSTLENSRTFWNYCTKVTCTYCQHWLHDPTLNMYFDPGYASICIIARVQTGSHLTPPSYIVDINSCLQIAVLASQEHTCTKVPRVLCSRDTCKSDNPNLRKSLHVDLEKERVRRSFPVSHLSLSFHSLEAQGYTVVVSRS